MAAQLAPGDATITPHYQPALYRMCESWRLSYDRHWRPALRSAVDSEAISNAIDIIA